MDRHAQRPGADQRAKRKKTMEEMQKGVEKMMKIITIILAIMLLAVPVPKK